MDVLGASYLKVTWLFLLACPGTLIAENRCAVGLIPNVHVSTSTTSVALATLKIIDESTFTTLQRGGAANVSLPLAELPVPITAGLSYNEWDSRRRDYLEVNRYNLTYDEAWLVYRREVPEAAYASYRECISREMTTPGIHIVIDDYTANHAYVTIKWLPPPTESGMAGPAIVTLEATGTSPEMGARRALTLGAGHARALTFPLIAGNPLVISAETSAGFSSRKMLDVSAQKVSVPIPEAPRRVTVKQLLLKSLDEGRTCVARMGGDEVWTRQYPYFSHVYEVRYDAMTETWHTNGRDSASHPQRTSYRGPSLAKGLVNIYDTLLTLGDEGQLTSTSGPFGRVHLSEGRLYCPFTQADLE